MANKHQKVKRGCNSFGDDKGDIACEIRKQEIAERRFYEQVWRRVATEEQPIGFDCPYQHKEGRHELLEMLPKSGSQFLGQKALDIGCGNGRNSILLAQLGYRVIGIDISTWAIRLAKQRAEAKILRDRIHFYNCSIFQMSNSCGEFDLVVDDGFFHHLRKKVIAPYIVQLARQIKHNGILLVVVFSNTSRRPRHPMMPKSLEKPHLSQFFSLSSMRNFFKRYFRFSRQLTIVSTNGRKFKLLRFVRRSYEHTRGKG